jgi:hypothetical protein
MQNEYFWTKNLGFWNKKCTKEEFLAEKLETWREKHTKEFLNLENLINATAEF